MNRKYAVRSVRKHAWTHVHSFFALQGGFIVDTSAFPEPEKYFPDSMERLFFNFRGLLFLVKEEPWLLPDVSDDEILDKSKADSFVKGIACLQAIWFAVQCIQRLATPGFSVSLLEMNVFTHSLCALLIYGLWWHKPLDVEQPISISDPRVHDVCAYLYSLWNHDLAKICLPRKEIITEEARKHSPGQEMRPEVDICEVMRAAWVSERIFEPCKIPEMADRRHPLDSGYIPGTLIAPYIVYSRSWECTLRDRERWNRASLHRFRAKGLPNSGLRQFTMVDRQPDWPTNFRYSQFLDIRETIAGTRYHWLDSDGLVSVLAFTLAGIVYGGLHLLAWNAPFKSDVQRLLWKVSALAVAFSGPAVIVFSLAIEIIGKLDDYLGYYHLVEVCLECVVPLIVGATAIFYVLARTYLVVECFISFAYLPDSAFKQPPWSAYFVHVQ
jgi:hypothetical protein